jgi:hypothetical protein
LFLPDSSLSLLLLVTEREVGVMKMASAACSEAVWRAKSVERETLEKETGKLRELGRFWSPLSFPYQMLPGGKQR